MTGDSKLFRAADLERFLKSLIGGEYSSLNIEFNPHACNYIDAMDANDQGMFDHAIWVSDEQRELALTTNSVWILQWYPDNPVDFSAIAASSLEALLSAAESEVP